MATEVQEQKQLSVMALEIYFFKLGLFLGVFFFPFP